MSVPVNNNTINLPPLSGFKSSVAPGVSQEKLTIDADFKTKLVFISPPKFLAQLEKTGMRLFNDLSKAQDYDPALLICEYKRTNSHVMAPNEPLNGVLTHPVKRAVEKDYFAKVYLNEAKNA